MSGTNVLDMSSVNHTCSDSSDSELTKGKIIKKFKRKLIKKQSQSDTDSDNDIFWKRGRIDENLPKYYEHNSIQNQEGYFGGLLDIDSDNNSQFEG